MCDLIFNRARRQEFASTCGSILGALVLALAAHDASGQTNCSACWTNLAIHWHGTYNLTLTGSGTDPTCGGTFQVNNSSQGTFDITNNLGTVSMGNLSGSGSVDASLTCHGTMCTISGAGPLLPSDNVVEILLNLSNCTYTVLVNDVVAISETVSPCGGQPSCTASGSAFASGQAADGIFGAPPYFPLPAFGEALVASANYPAAAETSCLGLTEPCTVAISWNIQTSFDSPAPPTFSQLPTGGPLGCNPTNLPSDADVLNQVQVNAASGNFVVTAAHVDTGSFCQSNRAFTITATDTCEETHATAVVVYTWTTDTLPPIFTALPSGGSLGTNPAVIPTDASILAQVGASDDCAVISTNVTHVDGGNTVQSNRTFTITVTDTCTNQTTTNIVYTWTSGLGPPPLSAFLSGRSIVISWPTGATGFVLQATTNPALPGAWTTVTDSPSVFGANYYITNRLDFPARFFWLFK